VNKLWVLLGKEKFSLWWGGSDVHLCQTFLPVPKYLKILMVLGGRINKMRNKQRENELIKKRNRAYQDAEKYEAQLKKEMGISEGVELGDFDSNDFFNKTQVNNKHLDSKDEVNELVKLMNENRGFINEGEPLKKESELAALMNEARGL